MRLVAVIVSLFLAVTLSAQPPARPKMLSGPARPLGKVIREVWFDRYNEQGRLGWVQIISYEIVEENRSLIRTVQRDHLRYLRSGDPYQEDQEQYTIEDQDGTIVELGYRTSLGKNQDLVIRGRPQRSKIVLEVLDHAGEKVVYRQEKPWDQKAKGLLFQDLMLKGKDLTAGKKYEVSSFLSILNAVVPTSYTVKGRTTLSVGNEQRELVHLEQSYPKEYYLDKNQHFIDPQTGETVLSTEDNALFGKVTHQKITKEMALRAFDGKVKDKEAPVAIDKPLPIGLLGLPKKLQIKIEMSEDDDPGSVFAGDARQQFVKKHGRLAEYHLAYKKLDDAQPKKEPKPAKEFLESNFYVRSDDAEVKKVAQQAVGDAVEPRRKMERITSWVRKKIAGGYEVGFATADEVARTLEGDCTEMGILSAAMGRAVGIPTRVCFGIVYDPENPGFGGHLWTEAWIDEEWIAFDATGVLPLMGAAYLKVDGFSFKDVLNPDELSPIRRAFAGRMKIYLLQAK